MPSLVVFWDLNSRILLLTLGLQINAIAFFQRSKTTFNSSCYCHVLWDTLYLKGKFEQSTTQRNVRGGGAYFGAPLPVTFQKIKISQKLLKINNYKLCRCIGTIFRRIFFIITILFLLNCSKSAWVIFSY